MQVSNSSVAKHLGAGFEASQAWNFFVAGAIVFRLVTTLEAYLRTSGESNHHRYSTGTPKRQVRLGNLIKTI